MHDVLKRLAVLFTLVHPVVAGGVIRVIPALGRDRVADCRHGKWSLVLGALCGSRQLHSMRGAGLPGNRDVECCMLRHIDGTIEAEGEIPCHQSRWSWT